MEKNEIISYLKSLRTRIVKEFETLESGNGFQKTEWKHPSGGGGEISLLRGKVFEKAAVNWSGVSGDVFPLKDGSGPYFATGISVITHLYNPHAPTVHFNLRYIETKDTSWLGGGYDLTPMGFPYEEDTHHFHQIARKTLGESLYTIFSQNAKDYFYIPHRQKERGVGGIFFDHLSLDFLPVWQEIGNTFLDAIIPIYQRRIPTPLTEADKEKQLQARAHYVEFNLLYDRGTQFGFRSGGNPDAILCSLPPLARW